MTAQTSAGRIIVMEFEYFTKLNARSKLGFRLLYIHVPGYSSTIVE